MKRIIKRIVIIHPYSHKMPNRAEHAKNFLHWKETVIRLKEEGCYVVQVGKSGEPLIGADEIVLNASFDRLKKELDRADTFVCVDSFFQHFARYHNRNGIVIFSKSDPDIFGYPENVNLLKSRDYLRKDQFLKWDVEPYDVDSFVSVEDVIDSILKVIKLR